jgi:hypothetical protein
MTIEIERGIGCNFCNRSTLSSNKTQLKYPYDFVYTMTCTERSGTKVTICEDCIKELYLKTIAA